MHFIPNPRLAGAGLKIALCEDGGDAGRVEQAFVVVVRAETRRGHRDVPGLLGLPPEGSQQKHIRSEATDVHLYKEKSSKSYYNVIIRN